MSTMKLPERTYVVGKIPGYNKNIDQTGEFSTELLKGITFIDLRPMSYSFNPKVVKDLKESTVSSFTKDILGAFGEAGLFGRTNQKSKQIFTNILAGMQVDFDLSNFFTNTEMIRIIGANDSTFTETFTNNYGEDNIVQGLVSKAGQSKIAKTASVLTKGLKSYSHEQMISLVGNLQGASGLGANVDELMTGIAFGMNLAAPTVWGGSDYTSTLTVFIKLISPTGQPDCIKKNIIEPIMILLAASSPLTYGGLMYGFPLLWDIHAHGITNFRIGGIAAMSLIRGSFETTFTSKLEPTVIDVRLTLVPLLNDFAVQPISGRDGFKSINADSDSLGVQNPGDIYRGITNNLSDKINTESLTPTTGDIDQIYTIKL